MRTNSSTKSILIVGGSGYIGTHLALRLRSQHRVVATFHHHPLKMRGARFFPLNVEGVDKDDPTLAMASPDVVVYVAGRENMDWAGAHPGAAESVHLQGALGILAAVSRHQPKFIYLSSAYTFDGLRGNYHEDEPLSATSQLGKYKAAAEALIRTRASHYAIVRSSPVYGRGNGNTLSWFDQMRISLSTGKPLACDTMELHSFAPINGLIDMIEELVLGGPRTGVFHYAGLDRMSRFDFAKCLAKRMKVNDGLVTPHGDGALYDYSLNTSATMGQLKIKSLDLEVSFSDYEKRLGRAM